MKRLLQHDAVLVTVHATRGSVPRAQGTWMALLPDGQIGSIGGGRLEFDALAQARRLLLGETVAALQDFALGPSLGQCCGGALQLRFERVGRDDLPALRQRVQQALQPVALFGGGHVGRALVPILCTLPMAITWIDSRGEVFPPDLPSQVQREHSDPVHAAVADLHAGSHVLIMSFSHAEDLDIVAACLLRQRRSADLGYLGLIGSRSKWASFQSRLRARGFAASELARITCPIGVPGIRDKSPAAIAIAVAAQLLQLPAASVGQGPAAAALS